MLPVTSCHYDGYLLFPILIPKSIGTSQNSGIAIALGSNAHLVVMHLEHLKAWQAALLVPPAT